MNHLDEGTIHAWLDGAVDATRSREIEAHVAACPQCAAAVAEARGFVAGASRILNALDDVPANVTPRRAAPKRQWRAAPWVTSIAAALVLAIGVTTWNRTGAKMASAPAPITLARDAVPDTQTPAAAPPQAPVVAKAAPRHDNAVAPKRVRAGALADASAEPSGDAIAERVRNQADARLEQKKVDAVEAAPTSAPAPMLAKAGGVLSAPMPATSLAASGAASERSFDVGEMAGCYGLSRTSATRASKQLQEVVATSTGMRRAAAAPAAAAPARASADYPSAKQPAMIRLDTVRHARGYAVRGAPSDSAAIGWWRRVSADSVHVDLMLTGTFTLGPADRVSCPQP